MATEEVIVDAHVHVVSSDEGRYPRQPTGAGSTWWQHPNGVDELRAELDGSGVRGAVVVQAVGAYAYDCSYAADVTVDDPRLAFVGAIDMASDDVGGAFDRLDAAHDLDGVRLFGVSAAGSGWLSNGAGAAVWERTSGTRCVLVPTLFPDALPALRQVVEQHPDVDVALDHCAFPDLGGPGAFEQLLAMADLPRLHLKVTSHNLDTAEDPAPFLEALVEAFGPSRVCWGSDHPQHHTKTYPELLAIARTAARNLSSEDRASFLGANTTRLWWRTRATDPLDPEPGAPHAR